MEYKQKGNNYKMRVGLFVDITKNYKEQIRHAKKLGFNCGQLAQWDMSFYTEENLAELKKTLEEEQFEVSAFWCGWTGPVIWSYPDMYHSLGLVPEYLRQQRIEDLRRGAKFAYDLGVKNVVTHIGYFPDDPYNPTHIAIVQALKMLCGELKERGQNFTFETGEELPVTLGVLIKEIGLENVGVNFDPANLLSGGRANPNDAMDILGCRVFGMHAKDSVPAKFGEPKGREVPIGEGKVDFKRLLCQLKDIGYKGDIFIEHEMYNRENRDGEILNSKEYLEALIKEVGI